jgi:3-isopropylmalate/(R)-2-methylmalate dehydratase small subunit
MRPLIAHTGVAAPLRRANVDTDQICAAEFLKRITKTGYEDALFAQWRKDDDFVLNQPAYAGASVLVVGPSFGTGSSREHAVWALRDFGFRVIVGSGFADIFRGNCGKQGMLLATVPQYEVERLWAAIDASPGMSVTADLEHETLHWADAAIPFAIDAHTRRRLLEGLDEIGVTLQHEDEIAAFERERPVWKPRIPQP